MPGAIRIGNLGGATNGSPRSEGDYIVAHTDGTTQAIRLGFSEWTLNGGSAPSPIHGKRIAATIPYRDTSSGGREQVPAYVFAFSVGTPRARARPAVGFPPRVRTVSPLSISPLTQLCREGKGHLLAR